LLIDTTAKAHLPGPQNPGECHLYFAEGCHLYIALTTLDPKLMFMTSPQRTARRPHPGRLQIGMVAAFKSEWVAAFKSESPAGFIGIPGRLHRNPQTALTGLHMYVVARIVLAQQQR
jgi:hypothetical protein